MENILCLRGSFLYVLPRWNFKNWKCKTLGFQEESVNFQVSSLCIFK